jgi:hypothetical protein
MTGLASAPPAKGKPINEAMQAVRNYCLGEDGRNKSESTVLLHVSHSNLKKSLFHEIRLDMHMTIERVKHKLEFHTGTSAASCLVRKNACRNAEIQTID